MANPNIVNVSSIAFQNGGWQLNSVSTGTAILLTVSTDYAIKINSLYVCNTQATDEIFTITFASIGVLTGVVHNNDATATPSLLTGVSIPANTTIQVIDNPIYLMEADSLVAGGGATANDINLFMCWELFDDA